ncbi:predicted protein [Meyerozyma guilliermondii ATCC 6260]|uniref:Uncharacterized protein n=1 Tax=Meyerozyma guilliermondii (strain ATCC 6260 / CBS 566 / DSM 6381 / JCM 1539 / NBRC 10279 / NRRL Y-324) TaxID=294746 RepID=A5DMY9_PICGU|nr:uncharacterized protein PGUG_04640 [Meyerozyma guilliermondii ATCC 6260]EDK40542.2 predicted protein [Meyerozyma guilliermondii ATCC 6260]
MNLAQFNHAISTFHKFVADNLYHQNKPVPVTGYCKHAENRKYSFMVMEINEYSIESVITFHPFYQVPVMYFRVLSNSNNQALSIDQIAKIFSDFSPTSVTLDSPEVVPGVWFCIHPCETAQQMETCSTTNPEEYLRLWYAFYGVGATFPTISVRPTIND